MKFTEFSLHENLQKGIENAGYVECTPVQEQVLKAIIEGRDLYVQSQTGTGKTCAYLTSVIQQLLSRTNVQGKQALVMVPTRELAVQVQEEAEKLCSGSTLKCASFYGGVGYDKQVAALKKGADILIGTPGRVIDLNQGGQMDLANVGFLVIDEADRMFDMGFYPDLRTLIKVLPASEKRQTMLFSATLNSYVKNLAWEYTRDPAEITIAAENITVDEIDQELIHVSSDEKTKLLVGILTREKPESTIIFCNTKKGCEIIGKRLAMNGFSSEYIIGDMQQSRRLKVLNDFKEGKVSILVATDVAARGIDVSDLAMVVNYDLPNEPENYVHRIGRTARAGKSGKAYTFCSEKDVYDLMPIERYIGKSIPSSVCNAELLGEDKSEGVYIKLDSYGEDRRDDRRGDKRGNGGHRRAGRGRDGHNDNRRNGDKNRASNYKKGDYNKNKGPREEKQDLSNLSFEERMAVYKKKYANSSEEKKSYDKNGKNKKFNNKNRKYSNNKNNNQKNGSQNKNRNVKVYDNSKKGVQSQGLFARIKAFFSKKGK